MDKARKIEMSQQKLVPSFPKERTPLLVQLIKRQLSQGWNQTQLAKAVGVSPPTIGRWLKGENLPDTNSNNFKSLARVTGGTARSLLDYLDGKISLDEYLSGMSAKVSANGTKPRRNREEIQADILLLDPADIAAVIAFSADALAKRQPTSEVTSYPRQGRRNLKVHS